MRLPSPSPRRLSGRKTRSMNNRPSDVRPVMPPSTSFVSGSETTAASGRLSSMPDCRALRRRSPSPMAASTRASGASVTATRGSRRPSALMAQSLARRARCYTVAMPSTLTLPRADGTLARYTMTGQTPITGAPGPIRSRVGMAAVHVVADPLARIDPTLAVALDWDATLAFRRHVWSLGLAVAEAMDTSQRGMGFPWSSAKELIKRSVAEARTVAGAVVASGAGTDDLQPGPRVTIADVEAAYEESCGFIESVGGRIILMASRALAACAKGADDYVKVYGRILGQVKEPVIIHWLGDMFDPALAGYWGSHDLDRATETLLAIVNDYAPKIDGVKISLLDQKREIAMRRRCPRSVRMYTGDDFDYPTTIGGDAQGYSDALLGIFDVIAPAASAALHALDRGDRRRPRPAPPVPAVLAGIATVAAGLFAGAALYVSLVEHPARVSLGPRAAVLQFGPIYRRGAAMQVPLSLIGAAASIVSWAGGGSAAWLIGGAALGALVPFTLLVIMPTNKRLLDAPLDAGPPEATALLRRPAQLPAVRPLVRLVVFAGVVAL